jgi:SM-20-related protein
MPTDEIVAALADPGWCVVPDFLSATETADLRNECLVAHASGAFHAAGVGKGVAEVRSEIRGDQVLWIDESIAGAAMRAVQKKLEALRCAVNQHLYLGLFDVELHFAAYPPGSGYRRHLDRFQSDDRRTLTVIVYLNENWTAADGGQLRFWPEEHAEPIEIAPTGGTLVTFLSDQFWHEVAPAQRQRLSLTGWFRRR